MRDVEVARWYYERVLKKLYEEGGCDADLCWLIENVRIRKFRYGRM
ncbi:MAG: hypothetical protein J7J42_06240 [Thermoplasmata archaeon]|nr:hypothetical protein [Thermoplasmata archaeon]